MRWALQLFAYDYDILYVKGESIPHVDTLSRLDFSENALESYGEKSKSDSFMHWTTTDIISIEELRRETLRDPLLSTVKRRLFENNWSGCSSAERPFKAVRQSLSVEDGILCRGDLLVPPSVLRTRVMEAVHADVHCGAMATCNRRNSKHGGPVTVTMWKGM